MTVTAQSLTNYQVEIKAGKHQFISDEPLGIGDDGGPSPFDLLLSSLASCIIITLQMYARRKQWPLEKVEMELDMRAEDVVRDDGSKSRTSLIDMRLTCHGDLSIDQLKRLQEIAGRCPVHRTLKGQIETTISLSNLQDA